VKKEQKTRESMRFGTQDFMPKVNGVTFRCECGCNVFRKSIAKSKDGCHWYQCNSCRAVYVGEK
jgi:hypothetical protein